jgi:hypothetical protein
LHVTGHAIHGSARHDGCSRVDRHVNWVVRRLKPMTATALFERVLVAALGDVAAKAVPVFTFAFYHDHESRAVSVCVDTEENSRRVVRSMNDYNARHFLAAVADGDLEAAGLWQANVGRSLSLGDFVLVNVARTELGGVQVGKQFYATMLRAVVAVQPQVASLAPDPERLVFACSGPDAEVAYVWSLPSSAEPGAAANRAGSSR